jgi:hypothetical protein
MPVNIYFVDSSSALLFSQMELYGKCEVKKLNTYISYTILEFTVEEASLMWYVFLGDIIVSPKFSNND